MMVWVTCHMLPHLSGVPHLRVNRPEVYSSVNCHAKKNDNPTKVYKDHIVERNVQGWSRNAGFRKETEELRSNAALRQHLEQLKRRSVMNSPLV